MFKDKTVFVVGAGASAEFDLPVGSDLASKIASLMSFTFDYKGLENGDHVILEAWKHHFNDNDTTNRYLEAARRISDGILLTDSIDRYLHIHSNDEQANFCGKTAIVRAILEAELNSTLYYSNADNPPMIDFPRLQDTWLKGFVSHLVDGRQKEDIENVFKDIAIVCFNYDRCIEHYLIHALQPIYSITPEEAATLVSTLEIYHPYGTVGDLHTPINQQGVTFGGQLHTERLIEVSQNIRTYTEQIADDGVLAAVKRTITEAKVIVFLGFAYHAQNMDLLMPKDKGPVSAIFGTGFGISDHGRTEIESRVSNLSNRKPTTIQINNKLKCGPFLQYFQLSL